MMKKFGLFLAVTLLIVVSIPSCRNKVTGGGDGDTTQVPGQWRLVTYTDGTLRAGAMDTIFVRLYNEFGTILAQKSVFSRALADPNTVTSPVVTFADTVSHPWGTNLTPMTYWGDGGPDSLETIYSWVLQGADTMATSITTFKVVRP